MRAAAEHVWGTPSLAGRRIGVAGLGKVGKHLVGHLRKEGATVIATDIDERARAWAIEHHPEVELVDDNQALITSDLDIYAPCALGGVLNDQTVPVLTAKVITGAANNQLAHPGAEKALADLGNLAVPDYLANGGAVTQVVGEIAVLHYMHARTFTMI